MTIKWRLFSGNPILICTALQCSHPILHCLARTNSTLGDLELEALDLRVELVDEVEEREVLVLDLHELVDELGDGRDARRLADPPEALVLLCLASRSGVAPPRPSSTRFAMPGTPRSLARRSVARFLAELSARESIFRSTEHVGKHGMTSGGQDRAHPPR